MKIDKNIFVPLLGSLVAVIMKYLISKTGYQDFRFNGMPSGHAAAFGGLITYLYLTNAGSSCLSIAIILSSLYLFDLWRMYYFVTKDRKDIQLGHSISELLVGFVVGVGTVLVYSKYYKIQ